MAGKSMICSQLYGTSGQKGGNRQKQHGSHVLALSNMCLPVLWSTPIWAWPTPGLTMGHSAMTSTLTPLLPDPSTPEITPTPDEHYFPSGHIYSLQLPMCKYMQGIWLLSVRVSKVYGTPSIVRKISKIGRKMSKVGNSPPGSGRHRLDLNRLSFGWGSTRLG